MYSVAAALRNHSRWVKTFRHRSSSFVQLVQPKEPNKPCIRRVPRLTEDTANGMRHALSISN